MKQLPVFLSNHPGGVIRLTGHRIGLFHVIDTYQTGASLEAIHEEYPTLPVPLIQQVIDFYLANRVEVDAYVTDYRAELERLEQAHPPSPAVLRIRERLARRAQLPPESA